MLDGISPAFSVTRRPAASDSVVPRLRWEKHARATFSRTLRHHARDAALHQPEDAWTEADCDVADRLLRLYKDPAATPDTVVRAAAEPTIASTLVTIMRVWPRLQTYPYCFEPAHARGELNRIDLHGARTQLNTPDASASRYSLAGGKSQLLTLKVWRLTAACLEVCLKGCWL